MWYAWTTLLVVSCALAEGETTTQPAPVATPRPPARTLDRQADELAWRSWLQSPESGNPNAPPRRITTKSLFITPLVCPKGQRLDRNGCVQVVTINKDEHERILLEQLNALFKPSVTTSGDVIYDYGDEPEGEPGPLQLSIPIGLDPQAAPLQAQEPSAQAQEPEPSFIQVHKKDQNDPDSDASIVAELELLKLQHGVEPPNNTADGSGVLNHDVLQNFLAIQDKPKRDSVAVNDTDAPLTENSQEQHDQGEKEIVFGHVNVDPVLYDTVYQNQQQMNLTASVMESLPSTDLPSVQNNETVAPNDSEEINSNVSTTKRPATNETASVKTNVNITELQKDNDKTKLNPENDYSDIGEAIKLISRYADVTTDDNYSKDQKKNALNDESVLGTRTKLQYRRNKPREQDVPTHPLPIHVPLEMTHNDKAPEQADAIYRYPWLGQLPHHSATPPPNFPFRHLQDYWNGHQPVGGVYNGDRLQHENPKRHHHSYNFRPHGYINYPGYPGSYPIMQEGYAGHSGLQGHPYPLGHHLPNPVQAHTTNQDLYSLLGLRHWFSGEGATKR